MCPFELLLVMTLAFRCRAATVDQVARLLELPEPCAERIIRRCVRKGLVTVRRVLVAEPGPSAGPVAHWSVNSPVPDFGPLSYRLKSRATGPTRFTAVVTATARAARLLGGATPNLSHPLQLSHDLVVTVCDRAHEDLGGRDWAHWSVPDPVPSNTVRAFDAAYEDVTARAARLASLVSTG